ncbi:MAG: hypothetical protein ACP5HQ_08460 [Thermoprotei archaeon]
MRPEECKDLDCVRDVLKTDLGIDEEIVLGDAGGRIAKFEGSKIVIDVARLDSFQAEIGGESGLMSAYITGAVLYAKFGRDEAITRARKAWGDSLVIKVLETLT